jgi:hypothetical protein
MAEEIGRNLRYYRLETNEPLRSLTIRIASCFATESLLGLFLIGLVAAGAEQTRWPTLPDWVS